MNAGSVTKLFRKVRQHRMHHPLIDGRCRTVVKIYSSHRSWDNSL